MDIVQSVISILGFIITYLFMRKSFKDELIKQKANIHLDEMSKIPYECLMFYKRILNEEYENNVNFLDELECMYYKIYAYGTKDAIKILSSMGEANYLFEKDEKLVSPNRLVAFFILLASQIKYDITGILVPPFFFYQMKIEDCGGDRNELSKYIIENNSIIRELNLNKDFLMASSK